MMIFSSIHLIKLISTKEAWCLTNVFYNKTELPLCYTTCSVGELSKTQSLLDKESISISQNKQTKMFKLEYAFKLQSLEK